jgi:hypothetical protein
MMTTARLILGCTLALGLAGAALATGPAGANEGCLGPDQRRAIIASRQAVPLTSVIWTLKSHMTGVEIVRAQLCNHGKGLVYVLTLLAHDGRVTRAEVDAVSGTLVGGR